MTDYTEKARNVCRPSYSGASRVDDAQHVEDVATALREAHEAGRREHARWRPIETAPKDGSRILVWYDADSDPYCAEEEGKLTPYGTHAEGGDFLDGKGICVAVWVKGWHEPVDEYSSTFLPGWWFAWFNGDTDYAVAPTHWMPLPEPPETAMEARHD